MGENKILSLRPHGGCCIVWNTGIKMKVTSVPCESDRLCALLVTQESGITIQICNFYRPCDQRREGDNLELFNDILCEISILRKKVNALYFVLGGDMNKGFNRNSPQSIALREFLGNKDCICFANEHNDKVPSTFVCSYNDQVTSTIDHICVSSVLGQFILDYNVMNDVDNFSDHNPVICQLDMSMDYTEPSKFAKCHKTSWNEAKVDHFQDYARVLDVLLSKLNTNVPGLLCSDINCKSSDHVSQLNDLYNSIIDCLCLAESESLPQIKTKEVFHNAGIPGWHVKVAPFREHSIFWRDIWQDNGSPRNGNVADIMR